MAYGGSRPWLLSLGLHALAVAVVIGWAVLGASPPVRAVRMHLVAASGTPGPTAPGVVSGPWWTPGPVPAQTPEAVRAPDWAPEAPSPVRPGAKPPASTSLDELLGPDLGASEPVSAPSSLGPGWAGSTGDGYVAPPLPPPRLTPPQGARWTLVLTVPGAGGLVSAVEGLDSGHPELDQWLESFLRTVAFPPGLDGQDYHLRWVLRLDTGKPQ